MSTLKQPHDSAYVPVVRWTIATNRDLVWKTAFSSFGAIDHLEGFILTSLLYCAPFGTRKEITAGEHISNGIVFSDVCMIFVSVH